MKIFVTRLLQKVGLFQVVFDHYNTARAIDFEMMRVNRRVRRERAPGDPPLPSIVLVTSSAGTPSLRWFVDSGAAGATCIGAILERNGLELSSRRAILDFGCGCGRVFRHLPSRTGAALYGADVNPRVVRWCGRHLTFGDFRVARLEPPLPYSDGAFDLVYSFSVFTHLPEALGHAWMRELARVLEPGGLLLVSLHGPSYLQQMSEDERRSFEAGELVVRIADVPGSNRCAAYHPPEYAREVLFRDFEVLEYAPEGALGNPHQDLYLLRLRPSA